MALRKLFVGGNWKCNNTFAQTESLIKNVINKLTFNENYVDVIVSPTLIHLRYAQNHVIGKVQVSSQNCSLTGMGAFTGETSPQHLIDFGLKWTILGHSERRSLYHEDSELVAKKAKFALENKLNVIFCCGESLAQRESGQTMDVVKSQLQQISKIAEAYAQANASRNLWNDLVVAYEPVWAIGTGKVASPEQAQDVHNEIRNFLSTNISKDASKGMRIIYGGSVDQKNCNDLIKKQDIDGFLVGGASLKPGFADIVASCNFKKY